MVFPRCVASKSNISDCGGTQACAQQLHPGFVGIEEQGDGVLDIGNLRANKFVRQSTVLVTVLVGLNGLVGNHDIIVWVCY